MNLSFVVPVLNGESHIGKCLESIRNVIVPGDEVMVIDNGSTDSTLDIVSGFGDIVLIECPEINVSEMRNRGAEAAANELLAFIDSDCIVRPGWRVEVMRVMQDEAVHATGASCEVPDDAGWLEKSWFSQKSREKRKAKYLNTANLIVRRDVFTAIGGFDPALVSDEDCEFGERLNSSGYLMIEDPAIRVVHLGNPTTLGAFYAREKWHATSVLKAGSVNVLNLPNIMSFAFGVSLLLALAALFLGVYVDPVYLWLAGIAPLIPFITAVYRAVKFDKLRYIPALTLLWCIFFAARVRNMLPVIPGR